jgi:mannosyltransferase OCH1-like enzyme
VSAWSETMKLSEHFSNLLQFGPVYTFREIFYRFVYKFIEKPFSSYREKDCLRYLKKYYFKAKEKGFQNIPDLPSKHPSCIWTCWLQGCENAPPLVKVCIASMEKYSGGHKVVVVTEENMRNYVIFPDYIIKKYHQGIIPKTNFTDMLRTALLINHGGIWLDAAVLLTREIPPEITGSNLFFFQSSFLGDEIQPCSSWFIAAKKNSLFLKKLLSILYLYWQNNNFLLYYFIYHIAVRLILTLDEEAEKDWRRIPYKNNSDTHYLQNILFNDFDPLIMDYVRRFSFAHKLTYKFADRSFTEKIGTFYSHLIQEP